MHLFIYLNNIYLFKQTVNTYRSFIRLCTMSNSEEGYINNRSHEIISPWFQNTPTPTRWSNERVFDTLEILGISPRLSQATNWTK